MRGVRLLALVASVLGVDATAGSANPTVKVNGGSITGTTTSISGSATTVNQYLGIPFAEQPQRFAPAVKIDKLNQSITATKLPPACIQQFTYPPSNQQFIQTVFSSPTITQSEDCLYLNVYTPSTPAPPGGWAVMFFIFGGGFQFGTGSLPEYDGSWFAAQQDVVIVTSNYRVNVFGFPGSPQVQEQNLGLLDQRVALGWVQDNIAAFGGSPDKVTIFGQSAGAVSIDALITSSSPTSKLPFRAAILESGQSSYGPQALFSSSTPGWQNLSAQLGCPGHFSSDLDCMRAAPVDKIQNIIDVSSLHFGPFPDNKTLVSDGAARRASGNIAHVPILTGTNAQEGRVFTVGDTNATAFLDGIFGGNATAVKAAEQAFPHGSNGINTGYDLTAQLFTEWWFQCPQASLANATTRLNIPTWRYYFNASFENTQPLPGLGIYHSSELWMVFNTYLLKPANTTSQEYALASAMQTAWARFAKDPFAGPGWNPLGTGISGMVLVGATEYQPGGDLVTSMGNLTQGAFDLGVWGNVDNVQGGGITVVDQAIVDSNCYLFDPAYAFEMRTGSAGATL